MSACRRQFVFGYGSLAAGCGGRLARLEGHRRVWGVAMDNRVAIPGYKAYQRPGRGARPAVYVAFLDLVVDPDSATTGVLLTVDGAALSALDARERNYERVDVTAAVPGAEGTVWAYRGSAAGRARLRLGVLRGSAVVHRGYLEAVRAGFAALGIDDDAAPGALPVVGRDRVELPSAP
jgi:gamma-glutamylcyclotransferase (GGCT)/AIG2-like uncharacterized protein YtfP